MEPNQDKHPEKRSVRFIEGKGFYIALVLCAAVIGVSAWSLLADTKTMDDERAQSAVLEVVPTPVVPVPETPQPTFTVGIDSRFAYVQRKPSARSVTTVVP